MDATDIKEVNQTLWTQPMRCGQFEARLPRLPRPRPRSHLSGLRRASQQVRPELEAKATARRPVSPDDYKAKSVLFVPDEARLSNLALLPEATDLGAAANVAMRAVEEHNPELKDVLPRGYQRMENEVITSLLRLFAPLPRTISGDAFGLIYEYFLSKFAAAEGRNAGEFFTPSSIVRLIVEVLEPFNGRVFDPSCGSGGMFVQCGKFVERRQGSATADLSVYGQEYKEATVPLAKMNLALNGLSGQIALGNSYYDDIHQSVGKFDFVMANPPFNVDGIRKDDIAGDKRFPLGIPRTDNGNYLWIQMFASALNATGRAGSSWRTLQVTLGTQSDIRQQLIESRTVDVMIAIEKNFLHLPVRSHSGSSTTVRKGANEKISAVHRRTQPVPTDRQSTPRLSARTHRIHCEHRPPLPRRRRPEC